MKRLIKLGITVVAAAMMFGAIAGTVAVTSATAQQRYPWNGLVDITVTIQAGSNDVVDTVCTFVATNCATKSAIPVVHVTRNGEDAGTGNIWTRKFIWNAKADVGAVKIDDVALTVDAFVGVQLWENGPYWATCNVGAMKPEESGYYFWWGDTVGCLRNGDNWDAVDGSRTGFSFCETNCPTCNKDNIQLEVDGYIGSNGSLTALYDAATAYLGAPWRMPTDAEWGVLNNNCTTTWFSRNGVLGLLVSGKGLYASKSIFLPAAGFGYNSDFIGTDTIGYYLSSVPNSSGYGYMSCTSSLATRRLSRNYSGGRYYGQVVRPLRGFAN